MSCFFSLSGDLLILKLTGENGNASYFTANHFSRTARFMHINSKLSPPEAETPDLFPGTVTSPSTHKLQMQKVRCPDLMPLQPDVRCLHWGQ